MKKNPYVTPATDVLSLVFEETLLASTTGTGSNLGRVGDYDDDEFDDLFN